MRIAACLVLALLSAAPATAKAASVEGLFLKFGLFGNWAADCNQPAAPDNPHVSITRPSPGEVVEDDDFGSVFATNRYSVSKAARLSASRLKVAVIFAPGTDKEERQKLVFLIRNGTRRTLFNRPDGGPARVKHGIAVATDSKTPVLRKCG